jgi:DNA-directed RNA polymerase specialized sigma24 family protein
MFEIVMRPHNQLLRHVSRATLGNDGEAEETMQDAYAHAYEHPHHFAGRAKLGDRLHSCQGASRWVVALTRNLYLL